MFKRVLLNTFILILICQFGVAQGNSERELTGKEKWKNFLAIPKLEGILLGVHGARETMFEIGYFQYMWEEDTHSKIPLIGGLGYSLSTEHYINDNYVIAPKAAIWTNALYFNVGMSFPWYFDMEDNNSFRIRPEIGIGSGDFKLTYALNMAITNKDMKYVSKHMVSAIYFLNFNKTAGEKKLKW
jgi:hypothetical protein